MARPWAPVTAPATALEAPRLQRGSEEGEEPEHGGTLEQREDQQRDRRAPPTEWTRPPAALPGRGAGRAGSGNSREISVAASARTTNASNLGEVLGRLGLFPNGVIVNPSASRSRPPEMSSLSSHPARPATVCNH